MNNLKSKVVISKNILMFVVFVLLVIPRFLSPIYATTDGVTTPLPNPFSNLASLSGAGFCEENGLYSMYTEENTFEKSGSTQSLIYTGISMVGGCYSNSPLTASAGVIPVQGGLISSFSNLSGNLYNARPVSLAWQIDNTIKNVSPNKETLAASYLTGLPTGASLLNLVAGIHKSVLDLVLIFYIFIFLVIGGAMIFRNKLGGQEYVSIVNSIPRVIISLVLVIFSLPISGLIIDLGNVGYAVVYNIFVNDITLTADGQTFFGTQKAGGDPTKNATILNQLLPTNPEISVWRVFGLGGLTSLLDKDKSKLSINFVPTSLTEGNTENVVSVVSNLIKGLVSGGSAAGWFIPGGFSGLLVLVMTLGAAIAMFKTLFALIKEYLVMIFFPILSPIQFAIYAIPGQNKQISNYIKTLLGSVLSFVGVYAVFVLIVFIGKGWLIDTKNSLDINPPLLGISSTSLGSTSRLIISLAGYGLFIIASSIPDMIKNAVGAGADSFAKYGSQIAETTKSGLRKIPIVGSFV